MSITADQDVLAALESIRGLAISENVTLAKLSRWRIGGSARFVVEPSSGQEVAQVMSVMRQLTVPLFVMGDSSNVLFDSQGFHGVIMRIGRRMGRIAIDGTRVWAEAGIWVPKFARRVGGAGLSGAEHTVGIPGTLGGLVVMNGGSQRKGIGTNVTEVTIADENGSLITLDQNEIGFAYRTSNLQYKRSVIVEARFEFMQRPKDQVRHEMLAIMADRRTKFPKRLPNCGSTFLSDPAMYDKVGPPGKAIELAGLKGLKRGGAQISPLHANFIVNNGGATSDDVLSLIATARQAVFVRTGHLMDCEVRHVREDGTVVAAHISADEMYEKSLISGKVSVNG